MSSNATRGDNRLQRITVEDQPESLFSSRLQAVGVISCMTCISAIGNLVAGLLTVAIPVISNDLAIPPQLQLWPAAAYALACGCALLSCGAIADFVGPRRACLFGALLQTVSIVSAGHARTSTQLIALRAVAGVASSCCLPGAVGVCSRLFSARRDPKYRNAAFAAMGGGQAIGFGFGIVLGGVCADTVGWRWGFFGTGMLNGVVLVLSIWALPSRVDPRLYRSSIRRMWSDIDWVGNLLLTGSLALFSYVLAVATEPKGNHPLSRPLNIALLCLAAVLLVAFPFWMKRQTQRNSAALIPNKLWKNGSFSTVCITVFLVWGSLNASEQLAALYFQDIRHKSALTASIYFLPAPICGLALNILIGCWLPRLKPAYTVPLASVVSGIAPLLLATLCSIDGPGYWRGLFQAMALNPIGADVVYVIANLVLTDAFPEDTQALAGSIFNMLAQLGKSAGIASTVAIASQVTAHADDTVGHGLLEGYKAGWFYNCGLAWCSALVSLWGMRRLQVIGVKRE